MVMLMYSNVDLHVCLLLSMYQLLMKVDNCLLDGPGTNVRAANEPTEPKVKGVGPAKCAGDGPAEENGPEGNRPSDSEKSTTLRRRKGNNMICTFIIILLHACINHPHNMHVVCSKEVVTSHWFWMFITRLAGKWCNEGTVHVQ